MLINLIASLIMTLSPTSPQTISQDYQFANLDIFNGEIFPFQVEPFDTNLGTLIDVQIKVDRFMLDSRVLITNPTNQYFPAQDIVSGISTVPWIYSRDNIWSMLSFGSIIFPHGDHYWYVVPPNSSHIAHRHTDTDNLWCNGVPLEWGPFYFSLLGSYDPPASYWEGDNNINLCMYPSTWIDMFLLDNYADWPGTYNLVGLKFGMEFHIEYTYIPG